MFISWEPELENDDFSPRLIHFPLFLSYICFSLLKTQPFSSKWLNFLATRWLIYCVFPSICIMYFAAQYAQQLPRQLCGQDLNMTFILCWSKWCNVLCFNFSYYACQFHQNMIFQFLSLFSLTCMWIYSQQYHVVFKYEF